MGLAEVSWVVVMTLSWYLKHNVKWGLAKGKQNVWVYIERLRDAAEVVY